jgi:acetoin:2,6-dichlorophenolindophenol oxidoreductase subunit beta
MKPAMEAAQALAKESVSVELIDLRTLKPLDTDTIFASVSKTGRLVIVENAHAVASVSAEIAALASDKCFGSLRKPVIRLTAPDVHVPFSPVLEKLMYPDKDRIVAAVRTLLG